MCPERWPLTRANLKRAAGFGLPLALFILIILGLLAAALYRVNATSVMQSAQEVVSARAFLAAESGAQSMMMSVFPTTGASVCSNRSIDFTTSGLNNCKATLICTVITVNAIDYYDITSTGRCALGTVSAERRLAVQAREIN